MRWESRQTRGWRKRWSVQTVGLIASFATLVCPVSAFAESTPADPAHAVRHEYMSHGVVRMIDRHAGRMVLRHGPIENLGVPPMTMIFRIKDPKLIEGIESGAAVRFMADRLEGSFTITHIERR